MSWLHAESRVLKNVTNHLLINLFFNYALILGMIGGICMYGSFPLFFFKFQTSATEYQKLVAIAFLPWSCKALVGAISDSTPIFGYHKRWWLVGSSIALCVSMVGVAYSQKDEDAVGWLLLASTSVMISNTLWEGQYANLVSFANADPRGVAFCWGMYMLGMGFGGLLVGLCGNKDGSQIHRAFLAAAPVAVVPLPYLIFYPDITLAGDRSDTAMTEQLLDDSEEVGTPKPLRQKPTAREWGLAFWLSSTSIVLIFILLFGTHHAAKIAVSFCAIIAVVSIGGVFNVYEQLMSCLCVVSLCHQMFWVNIQGALNSFFTAGPECFYDGPNFDLTFYYSVVQTISCVVGVAAALFYAGVLSRFDIRTALISAIVFRITTGIFDLVIIQRWNIRYLHLPDKVFYVLGDAIASEAATILVMLPLKTRASKMMLHGRTTTAYAILDSYQFLGLSISRIMGIVMTEGLGVRASQLTGCDWTQLPILVAMAHMVFPVLSLVLCWLLVPRTIVKID